jgi:hypothetical protein
MGEWMYSSLYVNLGTACKWELHAPACLHLWKEPTDIHCIGGWVSLIAGQLTMKKRKISAPAGNRNPISSVFQPVVSVVIL